LELGIGHDVRRAFQTGGIRTWDAIGPCHKYCFLTLVARCNGYSDENDEQQCSENLQSELSKPTAERDKPRLKKLFRATFKLRCNVVIATENGAVCMLVQKFPLLADMEFVS